MKVFVKICFIAFVTLISNTLLGIKPHYNNVLGENNRNYEAVAEAAHAGDVIVLEKGEWNSVELKFYANGAINNPVVLIAETAGKVILSGKSRVRIYGEYFEVNDLNFSKGYSEDFDLIELRKSSNQTVSNNRLKNTRIFYYNANFKSTEYKFCFNANRYNTFRNNNDCLTLRHALVLHNTVVNYAEPFDFGSVKDDEKLFLTINSINSNTLITKTKRSKLVVHDDTPLNVNYTSNPNVGCDEFLSEKFNNVPQTKESIGLQWNKLSLSVHLHLLTNRWLQFSSKVNLVYFSM